MGNSNGGEIGLDMRFVKEARKGYKFCLRHNLFSTLGVLGIRVGWDSRKDYYFKGSGRKDYRNSD